MMLVLAALLALSQPATHLAIEPWHGPDLPTATHANAKYQLTISGAPNTTVHLRATGIANGWIAAFCNTRVCSPESVDQTIPQSGRATLQFELIREDPKAASSTRATIVSDDGSAVSVP